MALYYRPRFDDLREEFGDLYDVLVPWDGPYETQEELETAQAAYLKYRDASLESKELQWYELEFEVTEELTGDQYATKPNLEGGDEDGEV